MQHQVAISAALAAVDDLGVFGRSGQMQLEGRFNGRVPGGLASDDAQLQTASRAWQTLIAERFSDIRPLRCGHRLVVHGQDVDIAATCVEPAEHGGAV